MKNIKIMLIILVAVSVSVFLVSDISFSASKGVITVYTSGVGGTAYIVGGGVARVLNKYLPEFQTVVEATGGTTVTVRFIAEKYEKKQIALGTASPAMTPKVNRMQRRSPALEILVRSGGIIRGLG